MTKNSNSPEFQGFEKYRICKHCNDIRMNHVDGKCLFESTLFEVKKPVSFQEVSWVPAGENKPVL